MRFPLLLAGDGKYRLSSCSALDNPKIIVSLTMCWANELAYRSPYPAPPCPHCSGRSLHCPIPAPAALLNTAMGLINDLK